MTESGYEPPTKLISIEHCTGLPSDYSCLVSTIHVLSSYMAICLTVSARGQNTADWPEVYRWCNVCEAQSIPRIVSSLAPDPSPWHLRLSKAVAAGLLSHSPHPARSTAPSHFFLVCTTPAPVKLSCQHGPNSFHGVATASFQLGSSRSCPQVRVWWSYYDHVRKSALLLCFLQNLNFDLRPSQRWRA